MAATADWPEPIGQLIRRIETSFRGGHRVGVVQFEVTDDEATSFHAVVDDTVRFATGRHASPAASVSLDTATLQRLAEGPDTSFYEATRPSGDRGLLALVAQALAGEDSEGLRRAASLDERVAGLGPCPRVVERRDTIRPGELLRALRDGRPLVLAGELRDGDWQASLDDLVARHGHLGLVGLDADILGASVDLGSLADLFRAASAGGGAAVYTGGCVLPGPMQEGFRLSMLPDSCFTRPQLWMGRRDHAACTRLHRDFLHAFIGQVHGVKSFVLYPPDDASRLYPGACFNLFQLARYDCFAPDTTRFPLAVGATAIELDLLPGELLVLPAGWFHAVRSNGVVMSVNRFMREEAWGTLLGRLAQAERGNDLS